MLKLIFLLSFSVSAFLGCASAPICPTEAEERVSTCRAEAACGKGKASTAIGMMLGGFNANKNARNGAVDQYNSCISRNLSAQKANAGIRDNSMRCESRQLADDSFQTQCHGE